MKLLLIGPYPPPHGGISVHVATAHRLLREAGQDCRVLDCGGHRTAPRGSEDRVRSRLRFLGRVKSHADAGFTMHVHGNGHNARSWLLAMSCGLAGRRARGRVLTLHSGLTPSFLSSGGARILVRLALRSFDRVLCVNDTIRRALAPLDGGRQRLATLPAYLDAPPDPAAIPVSARSWLAAHGPVLSSALFFRPEYAVETLLSALERLRLRHPTIGCLILGGGEAPASVRQLLQERGLEHDVLFAGDVEHSLCLALISRSDLFVRATLADGDANSVREALALGVPVVASDVGHRPPGVTLFPRGDLDGLVSAVELGLARTRPPAASTASPADSPARDGLARLLDTYREVSAP
jgi:glycosyltransferase involved in cell wall biosynthesis